MKYYLLSQSKDVIKPIEASGLDTNYYKLNPSKESFQAQPNIIVDYFKADADIEIPDILIRPTMLISNELKELFYLYDEDIQFKGVQLYSNNLLDKKNIRAYLYWSFWCEEVECLHNESSDYANGMIKELVIDRNQLPKKDIFKIAGIIENKIVISLPVAESILRRCMYGIDLEEIRIR